MLSCVVLLLALFNVDQSNSQSALGDECHLTTVGAEPAFDTDISALDLKIPESCTSGDVDWPYPTGLLHLYAEMAYNDYSLCIEESWFTHLAGITDLTNGGKDPLPVPANGSASCTSTMDGRTELMLIADDVGYYIINFKYSIVPT